MEFAYKMTPAFRHGVMTPWGGSKLKTLYGKEIPDGMTGESLEASTLPGLESRLPDGRTLTELCGGPLPLLLKFIDARECLSVQVHPDNAFAAAHEGKLGKEEAWLILHAEPGAKLVYGLKPGTDLSHVSGRQIEDCLRWVDVQAGDILYIPSGMVHAIGAGIVLYEIQQSSDVTYRFYDWNRTDKNGKKRELHLQKAVDVTDVGAQLTAARETPLEPGHFQLLHEKYFTLERFAGFSGTLPRDSRRFAILTATGPCALSWPEGALEMAPGQTALLPADGFDLVLRAEGALLSYPTME